MKLINIDRMPNFEVKTTDGEEYVLLPFKHLYDIPTIKAIPLEKVKQERERQYSKGTQALYNEKYLYAVEILDKLIEESEG